MSTKPTAHPKEIIDEINKLRANPSFYVKKVEEYINYFTGNIIKLPNINVKTQTQEGTAPYFDTIEYLKNKENENFLTPSKALCEIAQEIVDIVFDSETGEIDDELHEQIIDKHGSFNGKFTRAIDFGGFTSEQVVINFLVCDGDEERTQREVLLGEGLNKIGVAFGKHNIYSTVCVLVTCTEFTNTKDPDDIMIFKDVLQDNNKLDKEKLEKEKLEKERLNKEKLEKEKEERDKLEKEKLEKERLKNEKLEKEKEERDKLKKEKLEKEKLEKERLKKERLEKERLEREKEERDKLEKEKLEKEKLAEDKRKEEEKRIMNEEKRKEEQKRKKEEEKRKHEEEEKKKKEIEKIKQESEKKKKEEEKKKKETIKKKYEPVNDTKQEPTNIFKLKKKIYAYETVPKDQLPEGVASMTKSDTIFMEGGKRYKKIIYNKVMLDGTKRTDEIKECLD